jgi:hypothetical protein
MARVDYLLDEDFDLQIANGDWVTGDSDEQHIELIAAGRPGFMRQFPALGPSLIELIKAKAGKEKFEGRLREHLELDNYTVDSIDLSNKEWWKNFVVEAE